MSRRISKIFSPPTVPEGKGASVIRIIGTNQLPNLNPFMMLDNFYIKLPAGFPDHPHRGFETVTYLQQGSVFHEDSKGHTGHLKSGDIQWMTAGKGVLHAEMPGSWDETSCGFQLWINLQSKYKMIDPQYQEINKEKIPEANQKGVHIKVVAGKALDVQGPVFTRTPAFFMDVKVDEHSEFQQKIPLKWNSICYVYEGAGSFGGQAAQKQQVILLDINDTNETLIVKTTNQKCHFILIAGEPINEPFVQHGPFVMNTKAEIEQAFQDYQDQKNGFEGAHSWRSKIRNLSKSRP